MKTLLVTGGAGFIGSNLVRSLVAGGGARVVNVDKLTYAGNRSSLDGLDATGRHELVEADITDRAAMEALFARVRPDGVFHLAAESHVDRSIDGPAAFLETNVMGTFSLLQAALGHWRSLPAAEAAAFRFLHVSTDEVFGSLGPADAAFHERTPYDPHSPYSASKAASDHLARAWHHTYGLPVLVTNCSNNYGPYQFPEKLLPVVILKATRGEPIPVYGRGENVRDWLHVGDHVRALELVFRAGRVGETYLVGGNAERRNLDLVRDVCRILDRLAPRGDGQPRESQITFVQDRPGHDFRYAIDSSRLRDELGWRPLETLGSGLEKTVRWYLDNEAWWRPILEAKYRLQRLGSAPANPNPQTR